MDYKMAIELLIQNNSLTFTCDLDGNTAQKTYPRGQSNGDAIGANVYVENVTTNSYDVQVLDFAPSSNTSNHTFVSANAQSIFKPKDAKIWNTAVNIESVTATTITVQTLENVPSTNTTIHTFVSAIADAIQSGGGYTHRFLECCI